MELIDSHAHIQEDLFPGEIEQVISRSRESGIAAIVSIGTSLAESQEMVELAARFPGYLFPTVGLHPLDAANDFKGRDFEAVRSMFDTLASHASVVAIGECGLDYGKEGSVDFQENARQRQLLITQLEIAMDKNLPVVIHCRNAWDDLFITLESFSGLKKIILHSFTGDEAIAKKAVDRGYMISFSGIVTFDNAKTIQNAATVVPVEHLLIETDSPFLTPVPLRGERNEPKNLLLIAEVLAKLKHVDLEMLASKTVENTKKTFNVPL